MKRSLLIAMIVLLISIPGTSFADEAIGRITHREGRVDILGRSEGRALPVVREDEILVGDSIRTKTFSKAEITFKDNSILRLGPDTLVLIEDYALEGNKRKNASIKLMRGKMKTIVSKTKGKTNFFVATPNMSGEIKGSDILISYQANMTNVLVKEGNILVKNPQYPEDVIKVLKGEALTVLQDSPPSQKRECLDIELKLQSKNVDPLRLEKPVELKEMTVMEGWVSTAAEPVEILKNGKTLWRKVVLNESVKTGDEIITKDGGSADIRLENGNFVAIKENSHVKIVKLWLNSKTGDYENLFEAKYGKIKAVIEKLTKDSKFEVKTPVAVCGARGTIMYLDITERSTQAFYEGGGGVITSLISGQSTLVGIGQNSMADNTGFVAEPRNTTNEQRMNLDDTWSGNSGVSGYSSPGGDAGNTTGVTGMTGGTSGATGTGGTTTTGGDGAIDPFNDMPFNGQTTTGGGSTTEEETHDMSFSGQFTRYNAVLGSYEMAGSLTAGIDIHEDREINPPDLAYLVQEGSYVKPDGYRLWTGDLTGTPADDVELRGWMSGSMASWESVLSALYIDSDGIVGGVIGYLDDPSSGTFSGDGDSFIFPLTDEDTGYAPQDIHNDSIMAIENLSGTLDGEDAGYFENHFMRVDTEDTGIWRGFYRQDSAPYLPEYIGEYYTCKLTGFDNLENRTDIYLLGRQLGSDSSMLYAVGSTRSEEDPKTYLGMGVGQTVFGDGAIDLDITTAGISAQDEDLFGVSVSYNKLYDWIDGWEEIGYSIGLDKLSSQYSPEQRWAGYPSTFNSIGEFYNAYSPDNESFLWFCDYDGEHPFSSYNPYDDTRLTSGGAAYYGSMGGWSQSEDAFGNAAAIFLAPAGEGIYNAGLLFINKINGFYSDIIYKLIVEGRVETMQITEIDEESGIVPELLYVGGDGVIEVNSWDLPGEFFSSLPNDGSLNGTVDIVSMKISEQPWGIWDGEYHMEYNPNGNSSWMAMGKCDFVDEDREGSMYCALFGYDYFGYDTMRIESVGVTLIGDAMTFHTGAVNGIYDTDFHGIGTGVYFNEDFFPAFKADYSESFVNESNILISNWMGDDGDWAWGGSFDTEGGTEGDIDIRKLYGGELSFEDDDGESLGSGLCFLRLEGTYTKPEDPITGWNMTLGGHAYQEISPESAPTAIWFGWADGDTWNSGSIDGTFDGFYFSKWYEEEEESWKAGGGILGGEGREDDPVGKVIGHYVDGDDALVEGEEYSWEGICVSEWVEVTDLLDPSTFDTLSNFLFEVPITEAHSEFLEGGGGSFDVGGTLSEVTFDLEFFQNAALSNVWTGFINGTYSGGPENIVDLQAWSVSWTEGSSQIGLNGDIWDIETNEWHADVTGNWNSCIIQPGSEAGGTFDPETSTFIGIGAGTWEED